MSKNDAKLEAGYKNKHSNHLKEEMENSAIFREFKQRSKNIEQNTNIPIDESAKAAADNYRSKVNVVGNEANVVEHLHGLVDNFAGLLGKDEATIKSAKSALGSTTNSTPSFDYNNVGKISNNNVTPISILKSMEDSGMLNFQVGDNKETNNAITHLVNSINKDIGKNKKPEELATKILIPDENLGEGIGRFAASTGASEKSFSNFINSDLGGLDKKIGMAAERQYGEVMTDKNVTSAVNEMINNDYVEKVKSAASYFGNKNETLEKIKKTLRSIFFKVRYKSSKILERA